MNVPRVAVLGSEGVVGRALCRPLEEDGFTVATRVDRVSDASGGNGVFIQADLHDYATQTGVLAEILTTHNMVIDAAWHGEGILDPFTANPLNLVRTYALLQAALALKTKCRIVLLSSVNAHVPPNWLQRKFSIRPIEEPVFNHHVNGGSPKPGSCYAASKVYIEQLGFGYAAQGLDVLVWRLGGVNALDCPPYDNPDMRQLDQNRVRGRYFNLEWEQAVWLSHQDLQRAAYAAAVGAWRPGRYVIRNLVSLQLHTDMVHDPTSYELL